MDRINEIHELLKKYNSEHLLKFYNELTEKEKQNLLDSIKEVDLEEMNSIMNNTVQDKDFENIEPFEDVISNDLLDDGEIENYKEIAKETIKSGKLAICIMAGGQGSRLGHVGPKGTFMVDLGNGNTKPIFELCISNIMKAIEKYNVLPYCFIMTSTLNNDDTIDYFKKNDYFGYEKEKIKFFIQGRMPLTDLNGNIVLENEWHVYLAPNGNGGIFKALKDNQILDFMKEKGIDYLYITNVDNILTNPYDEIILGNLVKTNTQLGVKTLIKTDPNEKVGVCCNKNGKFEIVEYIDLPEELKNKRIDDGTLLFKDSYFGTSYLRRDLLEKIAVNKLPFHKAKKKNEYIGVDGNKVLAEEINSIKYEMFIFDGFSKSDSTKLYRVKREDEFAPIKVKEDIEEAVRLYNNKS